MVIWGRLPPKTSFLMEMISEEDLGPTPFSVYKSAWEHIYKLIDMIENNYIPYSYKIAMK